MIAADRLARIAAIALAVAFVVAMLGACSSGAAVVSDNSPHAATNTGNDGPIERDLTDRELWSAVRIGGASASRAIESVSASRLRDLIEWAQASFAQPAVEPLNWAVVEVICDRFRAQPNATSFVAAEIAWLTWPIADLDKHEELPGYRRRLARALLDAGRYTDCLAICDYRPAPHYETLDDIRADALACAKAANDPDQ